MRQRCGTTSGCAAPKGKPTKKIRLKPGKNSVGQHGDGRKCRERGSADHLIKLRKPGVAKARVDELAGRGADLANIATDLVRGIELETKANFAKSPEGDAAVEERSSDPNRALHAYKERLANDDESEASIGWAEEMEKDMRANRIFNELKAQKNSTPEAMGKISDEAFG